MKNGRALTPSLVEESCGHLACVRTSPMLPCKRRLLKYGVFDCEFYYDSHELSGSKCVYVTCVHVVCPCPHACVRVSCMCTHVAGPKRDWRAALMTQRAAQPTS